MQKDIFLKEEGDQWYNRNTKALDGKDLKEDLVVKAFANSCSGAGRVLEVGCSDGYRLDYLRKEFSLDAHGIEPSGEAVKNGREKYPQINLKQGTADTLDYPDNNFDVIIYGFCLYLCDREDLFRIAAEGNRVLKDNGKIIILDFYPPFPYKNKYAHFENVDSYKMRYEELFLWNPEYTRIHLEVLNHSGGADISNPDDRIGLSVLEKNSNSNYPVSPFSEK